MKVLFQEHPSSSSVLEAIVAAAVAATAQMLLVLLLQALPLYDILLVFDGCCCHRELIRSLRLLESEAELVEHQAAVVLLVARVAWKRKEMILFRM